MKKALLFVSVLFVSVMTTACINNFAVQELNTKAKLYMEQGDFSAAIERLKSSIDLDDSNFETHYNLAVAYTQSEDYANAIKQYKDALELNPDFPDIYYSLAVAEENLSLDLETGLVRLAENGNLYITKEGETDSTYVPSEDINKLIAEFKTDVLKNYQLYLEKSPNAVDAEDVTSKINELLNAQKAVLKNNYDY